MNTIICIFFVFFSVEYPEAKELYTNAIKICPDDFTKEKSVFYANRAACLVKMVCSYDSNFVWIIVIYYSLMYTLVYTRF